MRGSRHTKAAGAFTAAFALTVTLFALWGMGHRLHETLSPQFATLFHLTVYEQAFTRSIFNTVYFVCAIPAAYYAFRLGYKAAILFGLGVICVGAFVLYPAAETQMFGYYLLATTVLSSGWVFLEVAANPLIASLGPEKTFVWRLNLAQAFYPLGSLAGVVAGHWLLSTHQAVPGAKSDIAIVHPYILLGAGVLVLAYLFEETRFPPMANERQRDGMGAALRRLLTSPMFLFAIAAQFFAVMVLAASRNIAGAALDAVLPSQMTGLLRDGMIWALCIFAAGRFAGCAVMRFVDPARLLALFSAGGIVAALIAAFSSGPVAIAAALVAVFLVSISWPTVLGLAIQGSGILMKPATALICMGGAAGGGVYYMMCTVWPVLTTTAGMLLPALSFAAVLAFAVTHYHSSTAALRSSNGD